MYNDNGFDELLHRAGRENMELFSGYGPDFSKIEREALLACRKNAKRHKRTFILKIAAACAGALILLNALLLFVEIRPVKAYQEQVRKLVFNIFSSKTEDKIDSEYYKESDEIQKVQKLVPYKIPAPTWLPPGYQFSDVQMREDGNGIYTVNLKYTGNADTMLVYISNDSFLSNTLPSEGEGGFDKLNVDGSDVYVAEIPTDSGVRSKCYFYNKQGLNIYISAGVDKQSLIKIVKSMN